MFVFFCLFVCFLSLSVNQKRAFLFFTFWLRFAVGYQWRGTRTCGQIFIRAFIGGKLEESESSSSIFQGFDEALL